MSKPRICEILGVEVGEEFEIKGFREKHKFDSDGYLYFQSSDGEWEKIIFASCLYALMNGEREIIRKPRFSPDEIAMMREYVRIGYRWLARDSKDADQWLFVYQNKPIKEQYVWDSEGDTYEIISRKLFPQIKWEDESPFDMKAFIESEGK